jgi:hypothetical protein
MQNLWPTIILAKDQQKNIPLESIKEQAQYLTKTTTGYLVADVILKHDEENSYDPEFVWTFRIRVPSLRNYMFNLFNFSNHVDRLYPVEIYFQLNAQEDENDIVNNYKVNNEAELAETLKTIFTHPKTVSALQILMAQAAA